MENNEKKLPGLVESTDSNFNNNSENTYDPANPTGTNNHIVCSGSFEIPQTFIEPNLDSQKSEFDNFGFNSNADFNL